MSVPSVSNDPFANFMQTYPTKSKQISAATSLPTGQSESKPKSNKLIYALGALGAAGAGYALYSHIKKGKANKAAVDAFIEKLTKSGKEVFEKVDDNTYKHLKSGNNFVFAPKNGTVTVSDKVYKINPETKKLSLFDGTVQTQKLMKPAGNSEGAIDVVPYKKVVKNGEIETDEISALKKTKPEAPKQPEEPKVPTSGEKAEVPKQAKENAGELSEAGKNGVDLAKKSEANLELKEKLAKSETGEWENEKNGNIYEIIDGKLKLKEGTVEYKVRMPHPDTGEITDSIQFRSTEGGVLEELGQECIDYAKKYNKAKS